LHENDKYPYEKIVLWLNTLLFVEFLGKSIIAKQLLGATYEVCGEYAYISIKFIPNHCEKYPYNVRVPVGMEAKQPNGNIVDFLLHIVDGFVDELEIYNMDLTEISGDFWLDNIAYRVDEKVKPKTKDFVQ
jgi:hypothetical protein